MTAQKKQRSHTLTVFILFKKRNQQKKEEIQRTKYGTLRDTSSLSYVVFLVTVLGQYHSVWNNYRTNFTHNLPFSKTIV